MPRAVVYVRTNRVGSKVEEIVELDENWDSMSAEEKEKHLEELTQEHLQNNADYGAYVIED